MNTRRTLAALALLATLVPTAHAGGPLFLFDPATQTPLAWGPGVDMYTDLGPFGQVTNARADQITADAAASWTAVPTSSFSAGVVGDFGTIGLPDITGSNANLVVGANNGGGIHVLYDTDGSIVSDFFGAPPGVLGIASPEFALGSEITESWMVMNGAAVDASDLPLATGFAGVFTHEMGHAINMAHTQTNGGIIFFGDDRGPGSCARPYSDAGLTFAQLETMFPFISPTQTGSSQATVSHKDDQTTLSDIYPAPGYPQDFATIEGTIFRTNGTGELTGVNVIARNVNDPWADAVSAMSGDFTQGELGADGRYRLTGLTPGADYVLYVDTIEQGGFSTPPVQPLPAAEEYWNAGESNFSFADPPCEFTTISVGAGETFQADVKFNQNVTAPVALVGPTAITITVAEGQIGSGSFSVTNDTSGGAADLTFDVVPASGDCAWITLIVPTSGTAVPVQTVGVTLVASAAGLAPGSYDCTVEVQSNDPVTPIVPVDVTLVVEGTDPTITANVSKATAGPVVVYSLPDGTGRPLSNARSWSGVPGESPIDVDATITVELLDAAGAPVVGFPAENIRVAAAAGGWAQCTGSELTADAPTDANGRATISGALFGGGFSAANELMQVIVDDPNLGSTNYPGGAAGLEIYVNSADLTGNLEVDLVDVGEFAARFAGAYDRAADFVFNGSLDIGDVGTFAQAIGVQCPAAAPGAGQASVVGAPVVSGAELALAFDREGTRSSATLAAGQEITAWVIARGGTARAGIDALDLNLRTSDNLEIVSRELVGDGLDFGSGQATIAGFAASRRADTDAGVALLRVRLRVTNVEPAFVWFEGTDRSAAGLPSLASEGAVVLAAPASGSIELPVASLNAGDTVVAPRALSMSVAPNPFNPMTTIRFALPQSGPVQLRILNVRGAQVTVLANGAFAAGEHDVVWNGTDGDGRPVASGLYYSQLVTAQGVATEKLMLVK